MSHGDSHDTPQGLHDKLDRHDSPSRMLVDHDSMGNMQTPPKSDTKDSGFGADPTVVTLYGKVSDGQWMNDPREPEGISKQASNPEDRAAIKVFKVKDQDKVGANGEHPLKVCRVNVQNPGLVSALAPIVKKENVHLDPEGIATF